MKIGIDISSVVYETGVSSYTRNLVNALLEVDKNDEFVLFGGSLRKMDSLKSVMGAVKTFPLPPTLANILWNRLHIFPIEWLIGKVDVFHSSDWTQPPSSSFKVTTIHDLVPLRFPKVSHPQIVSAHKARLGWVKKEVDKIIAVSEFTKREIVELLDIEPERIVVIHEASDPGIKSASSSEIEKMKERHKIPGKYLLVVGADPRKNIPAITQAYKILDSKNRPKLVIVGRFWEDLPTDKDVISLGHVSRSDLISLYSGAEGLVYTSLYEGFGLPILEAMQVGCPVVTSKISSMPEVAGDAAVLVDPTKPEDIAAGIGKVLSDRNKWIEKGREQAKKFSWEKAAKETLEVYKEAI